jgi:hypothetical protein
MVIDHSLSISLRLVIRAFIHRFRRQKQFRWYAAARGVSGATCQQRLSDRSGDNNFLSRCRSRLNILTNQCHSLPVHRTGRQPAAKGISCIQCIFTTLKKKQCLKKLIVQAINLKIYTTCGSHVGQRPQKREKPQVFPSREHPGTQPKQFRLSNRSVILRTNNCSVSMMHSMGHLVRHCYMGYDLNALNRGTEWIIVTCDMMFKH